MKLPKHIIPDQVRGAKTGAAVHRVCANEKEAQALYQKAVRRMSSINEWHSFAGWINARFYLYDPDGNPVKKRLPRQGDLIRIQLAASLSNAGPADWVRIETVGISGDEAGIQQSFTIKVRPAADPGKETKQVAHFYTRYATSTFCVLRYAKAVWALELGRNELPNHSGSPLRRLRNFIIALAARLGAAESQWKALMKGILKK